MGRQQGRCDVNAHELARALLAGPDLPVFIAQEDWTAISAIEPRKGEQIAQYVFPAPHFLELQDVSDADRMAAYQAYQAERRQARVKAESEQQADF